MSSLDAGVASVSVYLSFSLDEMVSTLCFDMINSIMSLFVSIFLYFTHRLFNKVE